ncbi:uncharacterized protein YALI1_A16809g [Yarrowia lipolytica]|uniref:Uncharacterized protein n=1 Tax=Yarrowia lipolytica TaxID=4952 RepID=A0A1D8N524_YARLL|nr:hypothetical protein YALI1_A16809g [Yarrowia lipolytica]
MGDEMGRESETNRPIFDSNEFTTLLNRPFSGCELDDYITRSCFQTNSTKARCQKRHSCRTVRYLYQRVLVLVVATYLQRHFTRAGNERCY